MAKKLSLSTKRFGARYGKTVKDKMAVIEKQQHTSYKCPSCARKQVVRVSTGIWQCKKCATKFASKAYTVAKVAKIQNRVAEL